MILGPKILVLNFKYLFEIIFSLKSFKISGVLTSGKKGLLAAIDGLNNPDLKIENFDDAKKLDLQNEMRPAERANQNRKPRV